MDEITLLDLACMLMNVRKRGHQPNIDVIKSIYEKEIAKIIALISGSLVLMGALMTFIFSSVMQAQGSWFVILVVVLAAIAFIVLTISLNYFGEKIAALNRNYLDIVKLYNLLSVYF
jgi:Na+/glutamate symporter